MLYYIDGYNLMFRILRVSDDLQAQREQIIHDLSIKIELLSIEAILVFDSQHQVGPGSCSHFKQLEIRFTEGGETADEYILKAVKRADNPQNITVITSDKKLAWLSRRRSAKTETVEEFITWLNKRYRNKLRHQKSPQNKAVEMQMAKLHEPPAKKEISPPTAPISTVAAEECFDFYLTQFEAASVLLEETPKKPSKKPVKGQKTKKNSQENDQNESFVATWFKVFERDLESDKDNDVDDFFK